MLSRVYMAIGIAEGLAGPAQALMITNTIWMTLLTVWVDGQELTMLQFGGMASGLLGAFVIALGDMVLEKV